MHAARARAFGEKETEPEERSDGRRRRDRSLKTSSGPVCARGQKDTRDERIHVYICMYVRAEREYIDEVYFPGGA